MSHLSKLVCLFDTTGTYEITAFSDRPNLPVVTQVKVFKYEVLILPLGDKVIQVNGLPYLENCVTEASELTLPIEEALLSSK